MSEMKKYMDIPRLGHKTTLDYFAQVASKNQEITIEIKYDGSNAQFEVDNEGNLNVYSRNNPLSEENNLRGFYQYVHEKVDPTILPKGYKVFGEWLMSHTVQYPDDMYGHFYLFDIFDVEKREYISRYSDEYAKIENYLLSIGMKNGRILYCGPYRGIEHIESIFNEVTKADKEYTGQKPEKFDDVFHEGIVIKSRNYRDPYGHQLFVKLVSERFKEVKKVKYTEKVKGPDESVEGKIVEFAVTPARVEKIINKLVDEGVLPEDFDMEHMGVIAKNVPKKVYEDIMKEEIDTIAEEFGEFDSKAIGKKMGSKAMSIAREVVKSKIEQRVRNLT